MSPFRIVILFVLTACISLSVIPTLQVSWTPVETTTSLTINYSVTNAAPELTEQQATATLENAFSMIKGLKSISSVSRYNGGSIVLTFDEGSDMAMKRFITTMYIRHLYPRLPEGVSYPLIGDGNNYSQSQHVLLIYSISGPAQPFQIKKNTKKILERKLTALPDISQTYISGTTGLQISITYDPSLMNTYGITPADITRTINQHYNISYPGIVQRPNGMALFLKIVPSSRVSMMSIENLIIKNKNGRIIRINDVASVFLSQTEPNSYFRINDENSVNLSIYPRNGINNIILAQRVKKLVDSVSSSLPEGYKIHLAYDGTNQMVKELDKTWTRMALSAVILLLFILLSYRSWRYLLTLLAGLAVNLVLIILGVWLFGVQIHLYTLAGIAISFGLMTDNAIVMIDYFHQYRNRKVFLALLAATLTTVSALMLVFFLPDEERQTLTDFVIIVSIALITSLMTALWFIPGLYLLVFKEKVYCRRRYSRSSLRKRVRWKKGYIFSITFLHKYRRPFYIILILLFGLPTFLLPSKWQGNHWYNRWYNQSLGSDNYHSNIKPFVDKWLGGTLYQFVDKVYEHSSFRDIQRTRLLVSVSLSYGHTPRQMNHLLKYVEEYLKNEKGIDLFITHIYSGQYGNIEITFKPEYAKGPYPERLRTKLVDHAMNQSGAKWSIYGIGQGFNNIGENGLPSFLVIMKGYNYSKLSQEADTLASLLSKHIRIQNINTNRRFNYEEQPGHVYELQFTPQAMATTDVFASEVVQKLYFRSRAVYPSTKITMHSQLYPVIVQSKQADSFSVWQMMHSPLLLNKNNSIRIGNIASLTLQKIASAIHKEDREYYRVVGFDYMGPSQLGKQVVGEILKHMNQKLPIGYTVEKADFGGYNSAQTKRKYGLLLIIILASFFICGILFESLKQPFYIITMIPISFIGLFLAFWLFDFNFDQGGYAAFVMLTGLVVNAAIFIVNDFNNLKSSKKEHNRKIIYATCNRARTIMLTIISTCCGLVPFLMGGENEVFWFSLAVGTIGGLVFSLFAVFIVLPVLMWKKRSN